MQSATHASSKEKNPAIYQVHTRNHNTARNLYSLNCRSAIPRRQKTQNTE
ncbi:hypothetical protein C7S16_1781 [Burkholderia thailandensis]|uniref:Uncharacterized protein n=1 Tax=Burkholderia thailandensis TaxID=57975 RepID=A0AAW9D1G8_BURTH|nr:hypothetical protein [Burkholderia thailandensis]